MTLGDRKAPLARRPHKPGAASTLAPGGHLARNPWQPGAVTTLRPGAGLASVTPIRPNPAWAARTADVVPIRRPRPRRVHAASGELKLDPGFPPLARKAIYGRDPQCVLAGWHEASIPECGGADHAHHRQAVQSGGTSLDVKHQPGNGLRLCVVHHDWAHLHPARARILGLIVGQGLDYAEIPVSFDGGRTWWLIDLDGYLGYGGDVA
jgi:hypothetical protein